MLTLRRLAGRTWLLALAGAAWLAIADQANAQVPGGVGGGGGMATFNTPLLRNQGLGLPNPINYMQYSSITGTKPGSGTVAILYSFGIMATQQGAGGFGGGGFGGGGFGGGGGGGGGGGYTGSTGGEEPPSGVMLSGNYAAMFFPNQGTQQPQQQGGVGGFGGGFPGFGGGFGGPGFGGPIGKGFANGGNGL